MDASLLKSLHFMMVGHDLSTNPGQWRPGAVWVHDGAGNPVYEAPDRDVVEPLIDELITCVNESPGTTVITAAMAHLNLALIHPFSDGNGRMARCLQSFVLARADSEISPVFTSIEAYLGQNVGAYYGALTDTATGSWSPERSARPWVEFCLTAHCRQAAALRRRIDRFEALWDRCEQTAARCRLADRTIDALMHSARGWSLKPLSIHARREVRLWRADQRRHGHTRPCRHGGSRPTRTGGREAGAATTCRRGRSEPWS